MVMDATEQQQPSPQSVGREFVRQYYTLLNKAPNHLHRFYNNQSSFIHGESTLVVGQKNIYTRIQQLNFHDCHAKISQVDAQATLGNGVVVQVTGELSNDGQPMRRFTQTFVLAAQSPKKYYVHNDIFRYQDMYSDEDNEVESRSENEEDLEPQAVLVNETVGLVDPPPLPPQQQPQPVQLQQQPIAANAAVLANAGGAAVPPQATAGAPPQPPIYYSIPTAASVAAGARPLALHQGPPGAMAAVAAGGGPYGANTVPPQAGGINQLNGVMPHDEVVLAQQPQTIVTATSGGPTGVTVLAAQNAAIPVANAAAMPQSNATAAPGQIAGFQQSPVLQAAPQQQTQQGQQTGMLPPQQIHHQQQPQHQNINHLPAHGSTVTPTVQGHSNDLLETHNYSATNSVETPIIVNAPIIVDDFKTINEQQQQEKYEAAKQQQLHNEPKTYANLFKTTATSPTGFVNAALQQQQQQQYQQQQQQQQSAQNHSGNSNSIISSTSSSYQPPNNIVTSTYTQSNMNNNGSNIYNNRNHDNNGSMHHRLDNNNGLGGPAPLPQRTNSRMNKEFDQRRSSNSYSDNHQLFLGNIPHHASEEQVKKLFQQFGTVLELRIMSKANAKSLPGVRNPLNYGFITYEDPESVQNCLKHCPLYYPEDAPDAQKLNVEEKKPRVRDMSSRPGMGNMNNMNNNQRNMSGGPQSRSLSGGGGSGGAGMMRGNNSANMGSGGGGGGGGNNMSRSSTSGGRISAFNRSGAANGGANGSQLRGGNNNNGNNGNSSNNGQSGGGNYGSRR